MSFGFVYPELLALGLPLAWLWFVTGRGEHVLTRLLRAFALLALLLLLAGLHTSAPTGGHTVIALVDRSASMPEGAEREAIELIELGIGARGEDDDLRVLSFGADVRLESTVTEESRGFRSFEREVDRDGSSLADAIETALSMLPEGASGSIVVLSDGLAGSDAAAEAAALRAAARGIPIHAREIGRANASDTAIERLEVPAEVDAGEPFFLTAWVRSDAPATRQVRLLRGADELARQEVDLPRGRTRLRFPALVTSAQVAEFRVEVLTPDGGPGDPVPENDGALAAVRARGAKSVLVINHDGAVDTLVNALRKAGIPAVPSAPETAPTSVRGLQAHRAVVIENVSAARLGLGRMETLASWVTDHGGGLMMTGGQASFGSGGYFESPLDPLLPVSMELRQEHRKLAVALSVTLDRSGSMAAAVSGGRTKMDLANAGTVAAIEMLGAMDSVSVIAVDSSPHVIQPQVQLTDPGPIIGRVRGIQSMGGGIFTATALKASAAQLQHAAQSSRHVILFADAADAEEQADTPPAIRLLRDLGATVSVIALGTKADSDAKFLMDCARLGGGEAYFTTSPTELPRLFAMETQAIARSTFVAEPAGAKLRPDLFGLGEIGAGAFPEVRGYNLTYLAPGASLGAVTTDEYAAPLVAFHGRGLGRVAALPVQLGGTHNEHLASWDGYASLLVTLTRWLTGVEAPEGIFADVRREGRDAVFTVEFDPDAPGSDPSRFAAGKLSATLETGDGEAEVVTLERRSGNLFEGRATLPAGAVAVGTVSLDVPGESQEAVALSLPPIALPYSPEFERGAGDGAGARLLRRISRRTGGKLEVSASDLFRRTPNTAAPGWSLVRWPLLLAALLCVVLEIAGRRLSLWDTALGEGWRKGRAAQPAAATSAADGRAPERDTVAGEPAATEPESGLSSALDRARAQARSRLR